jgi:hypothetical protein
MIRKLSRETGGYPGENECEDRRTRCRFASLDLSQKLPIHRVGCGTRGQILTAVPR